MGASNRHVGVNKIRRGHGCEHGGWIKESTRATRRLAHRVDGGRACLGHSMGFH